MINRITAWMRGNATDSRLPWRIFWTAFVVRVLYITFAHTYHFRPFVDHFQFGWEAGRIARSLVTGHGYGNPFASSYLGPTGPTAWLPPVYPLLVAAAFKLFGVYTPASAWVLLTLNSAFSAATALAIWEIALRCYSRRNAIWSAWIWALYPAAMQYAVRWIWEMTLTTALFAWVIVLALRIRNVNANERSGQATPQNQTLLWLIFGLLWGLIALSNSSLLLFLPICGIWILIGTWPQPHSLRNAILGAVAFLACLTPWEIRNYEVFHRVIPLRTNLGVEASLGNGPGSNGLLLSYNHPNLSVEQFHLYVAMGEIRYAAMRGEIATAYIHAHPAHFVADTLKRIDFYWASVPSDNTWLTELPRDVNHCFISLAGLFGLALALSRRVPASGLFAWAFLLLPIPYYLVIVHARFRHPLEPLITILGVYLFQSTTPRRASRESSGC